MAKENEYKILGKKREKLKNMSTHRIFHILWTKAVGTPGYDKDEWKELGNRLHLKGMLERK